MSVYQRGKKWGVGYSLPNGKWKREIIGTSKRQAEEYERKIKTQIAANKFLGVPLMKQMVFEKLCEEYLAFSKAHKRVQSLRRDRTSINNLLSAFVGQLVSEIRAHDMEKYIVTRSEMKVKPATINREISCIKHMFTKAVHWGYLTETPLRSVRKLREPPGRTRYLNDDEIKRLLYCCPQHIKPVVITALYTGMRKGEILNLEWSDIDLAKRSIRVRDSKNHESRHVPINDILYTTLIKLPHEVSHGYVFSGKHGKPIRSIQNAWERTLRNANISDFRFHDLRHTFASHLAMLGIDLQQIRELLGHKTIVMTMRYSHLSSETLQRAVDMLNFKEYNDHEDRTNPAHTRSKRILLTAKP